MIQLWFLVLFTEGALAMLLLVRIEPFWGLVMKGLDQAKTGRGPATAKTVGATIAFMLLAHYISIAKLQNKNAKLGTMTPMDQVLWRTHLLDATLLGFCLFLGFIIDRIHHYLRALTSLEGDIGASKEEVKKFEEEKKQLKEKEEKGTQELKRLQKEISSLRVNLTKVRLDSEEKDKRVATAEAHVASLQKQSADLLLEYDRLLEENEKLQSRRA